MIKEDYVSFEIAKLLREKGFDEKCQKVYMHNGKLLWAQVFMEGESFVDNKCIDLVANYNDWITYTQGEYAYLCSTLQMAMKWLREAHNIAINIGWGEILEDKFQWWCIILNQKDGSIFRESEYSATYEEACEAALKYSLENLI